MGGTEIGNALHVAYGAVGSSNYADVFLVTDGNVSSWEAVVQDANRSGHRIFTVGVGSAVSESFVRGLATSTGGECELVSPREGMADRVIRHFERMRSPRAKRVAIHWPDGSVDVTPSQLGAVFEGDTVTACARFVQPSISGTVALEVETETGELLRQELQIAMIPLSESAVRISTVARLAAAARLKEMDEGVGLPTALRYRLVSPWTNWLVSAERPEDQRAHYIPALRSVPQSVAAGWSGVGTVQASLSMDICAHRNMGALRRPNYVACRAARPEVPAPYRRLLTLIEDEPSRLDVGRALDLLGEAGLASQLDDLFRHAADLGLNVGAIAVFVLTAILVGPLGENLSAKARAAVPGLQTYARKVTEALREIGGHGIALAGVTRDAVVSKVLQPESEQNIREVLEGSLGFASFSTTCRIAFEGFHQGVGRCAGSKRADRAGASQTQKRSSKVAGGDRGTVGQQNLAAEFFWPVAGQ
jgi:hypothetical protein